ncbi:hypothetical protein KSP40_PGU001303 [Platanthera guangdongensis]|uniref:Uncharacterized protein n=1 Tax=Platanthera guangdongensis TaxID=2320717 RepID=A0ABR2LGA5_9ASPA
MLPPEEEEPRISSRESPNCSRTTRKRFFNQKEFSSDVGYLSRSFRNSIMLGKQREDVYERDIQQQEEGKRLNRGTPEHLLISDVPISMEWVTHSFDESFLRTEEDSVNIDSKSHLSESIV